jgi:hypothetical protein
MLTRQNKLTLCIYRLPASVVVEHDRIVYGLDTRYSIGS